MGYTYMHIYIGIKRHYFQRRHTIDILKHNVSENEI